jgi:hypothetical protein
MLTTQQKNQKQNLHSLSTTKTDPNAEKIRKAQEHDEQFHHVQTLIHHRIHQFSSQSLAFNITESIIPKFLSIPQKKSTRIIKNEANSAKMFEFN